MRSIVGVIVLTTLLSPALPASDSPRTITVRGDAEVRVVPDEVLLSLGIETHNLDLDAAKKENDQRMASVLQAVDVFEIPREHVRTDYLNIEPQYRDYGARREFLGYIVRKTVVVTLRDIDRFEGLLSSVLAAGANYVHGVDFRTTQLRKHRDRARAMAITAAREKAEALAGELGQKVGAPQSISEGYAGWWSWYGYGWGSGRSSMTQNVATASSPPTTGEGPTAPGQLSVTTQISVTFELED